MSRAVVGGPRLNSRIPGLSAMFCMAALALGLSAAPAPAAEAGPSAAWSFDEPAGTAAEDLSGNGNRGSIAGGTRVGGREGSALALDGTRAVMTVPNAASLR